MPFALEQTTMRILAQQEMTVGTGFAVSRHHVLTCAHVLKAAQRQGIGDSAELRSTATGRTFTATITHWSAETDVAVLELAQPLPVSLPIAPLAFGRESRNHPFLTFGYPRRLDQMGSSSRGTILTPNAKGEWQLDAKRIDRGMSGAPVYDTQIERVIGIVRAYYDHKEDARYRDTAFAIPIERVQQIWPDLLLTPLAPVPTPIPQNITVGERGVYVGGNVGGSIIAGDNNVINQGGSRPAPMKLAQTRLVRQIADLTEEHSAIYLQLSSTLDAGLQVRLTRQLEQLEAKIAQLEADLDAQG